MPAYPPPDHLLRDLRSTSVWISDDELHVYAPSPPEVCDARGMQAGVIAAVVDIAGAQVAMTGAGADWIATSDLSYQPSGGVVEGPLVISTKLLRAGSRVIVVRSELFDGRGHEATERHAGSAVMTFTRIPREAAAAETATQRVVGERHSMTDDAAGFTRPAIAMLGLVETAPGELVLEKSGYVLNSFGTVNGGATAMTVAAAAESLVGAGGTAADLSIRYVGQAGPGPLRTVTRGLADYDTYTSVDVELLDTSNGDRVIALATVGVVTDA